MLTGAQIDEIRDDDTFGWISCLKSEDVRTLLEDRDPSDTPLFSQWDLAEISHPDFPGERLVACFNEWHMRRALSSLLYVEDDLPAARESRNPVAKTTPTSEAKRKKAEKTGESGLSIRTWRGMIAALGTLCRTTILVGDAKVPVVRDGTPDAYQLKVFELLAADAPTWPRRCTQ